jgi:ABC-type branched-subunit amino acid transport system substrate-binding protein
MDARRRVALGGLFTLMLIVAVSAASVAGARTPRKKKVVPQLVSNTIHVVVPRGQPIQIAFAADSGFDGTPSLADAIQMAVDNHGGVLGFPIRVNAVNAPTCGSPPNAVSAATGAAYKITANLQNVAVLGQVCSFGFAQALSIYQKAGMVVVSGSATNPALSAAGPTVFNRTIVDDNRVDDWYAVISQLPVDLAWRLDYTVEFGAPPSDYADLFYDAASIVLDDIAGASQIDAKGELIVNRAVLATAVRNTSAYPGVTCSVTIDSTGDRTDDQPAISACAG